MKSPILVDTGPLVAWLDKRDRYHLWAKEQFLRLPPPLLTCDAVLAEACFLVARSGDAVDALGIACKRGALVSDFSVKKEHEAVFKLMHRYRSQPMSFADACLVRMSELHKGAVLLTIDSDFGVYRRNGREVIPNIRPIGKK